MITIIRDYEKEAIDNLITNWEKNNFKLCSAKREYLFGELFEFYCQNGVLPKWEHIKITEKNGK